MLISSVNISLTIYINQIIQDYFIGTEAISELSLC